MQGTVRSLEVASELNKTSEAGGRSTREVWPFAVREKSYCTVAVANRIDT